jgi:DNA polymerase IV
MDAFYASVEQREQPELKGRPVIVGAHSGRGVVAAASYEARAFGIRSAMPGFQARKLCPEGVFLPGRMDLYAAVSADVRRVFEEFTTDIEPLALDEAFLDVTGTVHLYSSARALGAALKQRVLEQTRLNVSVGIGPNKLVAKLACTLSKPNGLALVEAANVEGWMRPLPIRRLWGIGPVTEQRLVALGLQTMGDVVDAPQVVLSEAFGARAEVFRDRARGIERTSVKSERWAKSIGEENTFAQDVLEGNVVSAALTAHSETVAHRLRQSGFRARTVTLKVKFGRANGTRTSRLASVVPSSSGEPIYPVITRSKTLPTPTNDALVLKRTAWQLWENERINEPVRLLGVSASNLVEASETEQLDLFAKQTRNPVGEAMDAIMSKFGKDSIRRAVAEPEKATLALSKRVDRTRPSKKDE